MDQVRRVDPEENAHGRGCTYRTDGGQGYEATKSQEQVTGHDGERIENELFESSHFLCRSSKPEIGAVRKRDTPARYPRPWVMK